MINLSNLKGLAAIGKTFVMANRPELLFGASVAATLASVGLAAKGGYEARGIVDKAQAEATEPLTKTQMANLTWHCYVPAGLGTIGALGSTTGLHIVHIKEKKALATAALAAIDEIKLQSKEYADGLLKTLDENTPEEEKARIQEEINAKGEAPAWIQNSDGEVEELYLVRDAYTGRDIFSNKTRIEDACVEINGALNRNGDCEIDYFYTQAGFNDIPHGMDIGWSGGPVSLTWSSDVRDDGRPVRVFTFQPRPKEGFEATNTPA